MCFRVKIVKHFQPFGYKACRVWKCFIRSRRQKMASSLERKLVNQKDVLRKDNIPQKDANRTSFVVVYNIAKHSKSLCDCEYVTIYMLDVGDKVRQEYRKMFEVNLSRTVAHGIKQFI
ncbi:hypothetical protein RF11_11329 [Thelohanellus kitauei]|uniref:Uncharacterized protein n=1 Tax=Thelohanellus kitauei TaxID=669202 RepID=A0A0C2IMJ6_THEKT|nr:hypothetical protein RF11_11329 [Thelohanellus kitauei]